MSDGTGLEAGVRVRRGRLDLEVAVAVEPGEVALATQTGLGEQPRNAHAVGLALHVRDWVDQDGQLTSAGGHALERWLDVSAAAQDDEQA